VPTQGDRGSRNRRRHGWRLRLAPSAEKRPRRGASRNPAPSADAKQERSRRGRPRPEAGKASDVGWTARAAPCEHAYQGREHGPREWRAWRRLRQRGQGRPSCRRALGKAHAESRPPVSPLRRPLTGNAGRGKSCGSRGDQRGGGRARSIASTQRSRGRSPYFSSLFSAAPRTRDSSRVPRRAGAFSPQLSGRAATAGFSEAVRKWNTTQP
jgi:hypothetical protein